MADNVSITPGSGATVGADLISSVLYQRVKLIHGADGTNAGDVAIANPLPIMSNALVSIAASKTRPADTNAYAAGDVINESTSAGTMLTFTSCARATGGTGIISKVTIDDSAYVAATLQCELWLFNATYTADNDNAAFTPTDAETQTVVAVIPVNTAYVGDATAGVGGNVHLTSGLVNIPFICNADANLYGVLVARNAYVPISGEIFNVRLHIYQD